MGWLWTSDKDKEAQKKSLEEKQKDLKKAVNQTSGKLKGAASAIEKRRKLLKDL